MELRFSRSPLGKRPQNSPTRIPTFSVFPPLPVIKNCRLSLACRSLKCSVSQDGHNHIQVTYPRPPEISWKKELCNSVQLIGVVGKNVEFKHLPSGKVFAWTSLAIKKSANDTSWISLTFWDEVAHIASQHLEKGHQIYVSGRLVSDTVENDDGKQHTYYKVVVREFNFVERGISSFAPNSQETNSITSGRSRTENGTDLMKLWQAFFANPVDWWDNRKNKRNPNSPDFKHKDTGEALWIEGRRNPPWVKSQLAILDSRMKSFHEYNSSMNVKPLSSDNFVPF